MLISKFRPCSAKVPHTVYRSGWFPLVPNVLRSDGIFVPVTDRLGGL